MGNARYAFYFSSQFTTPINFSNKTYHRRYSERVGGNLQWPLWVGSGYSKGFLQIEHFKVPSKFDPSIGHPLASNKITNHYRPPLEVFSGNSFTVSSLTFFAFFILAEVEFLLSFTPMCNFCLHFQQLFVY